jgi:hypothetical protein
MISPKAMDDDVVVIARMPFKPRPQAPIVAEAAPAWTDCVYRQWVRWHIGLCRVIKAENFDLVSEILEKQPPLSDAFDRSSTVWIYRRNNVEKAHGGLMFKILDGHARSDFLCAHDRPMDR